MYTHSNYGLNKNSQKHNISIDSVFCLENVSVSFGKKVVLNKIQLKVDSGEIIIVIGPSGAGKTTLLELLAGNLKPSRGRIFGTYRKFFKGIIFQDLRLMENRTCYENLILPFDGNIYKNYQEFENDMHELTSIFGLKDRLKSKVNELNGGAKQKLTIIRSLLTRPDILLADEATNSLDIQSAKKVFEILNLYNIKRKLTIVWSTHNRELLKYFSGRVVQLEKGRMIFSGYPCSI